MHNWIIMVPGKSRVPTTTRNTKYHPRYNVPGTYPFLSLFDTMADESLAAVVDGLGIDDPRCPTPPTEHPRRARAAAVTCRAARSADTPPRCALRARSSTSDRRQPDAAPQFDERAEHRFAGRRRATSARADDRRRATSARAENADKPHTNRVQTAYKPHTNRTHNAY